MEQDSRYRIPNIKQCQQADFVDHKILGIAQNEFLQSIAVPFVASVYEEQQKQRGHNCLQHRTEEYKVKFVKEKLKAAFPVQARQPQLREGYKKSSESSKLLRNHGNSLFKERKFQDALHYFNMALLFGLGESVGLAYANRAAVLMELGDPAGALQDIDLALKHDYPAARTQKLDERKLKCVQMIEKKASEDAVIKPLIDQELIELNKVRDSIGQIEKRNPRVPAAAEFVEIKFDETFGRQLVVTRDVDAGTLLLLEDPYVCVLEGQVNWDTEHCHHCFKRTRRGIPCDNCVFAFYCSEACLKKSAQESTHRLECSILPCLHLLRMPEHSCEALKVICKVGPAELYRLFSTRDPDFLNRKQSFGAAPEDIYESDSYLSVYHLQSQPECLDFVEQCVYIHQVLLMTEYLHNQTNFFELIPRDEVNEFMDFVAALMVHHIESRLVNATALTEFDGLDDLTLEICLRQRMNEPEKLAARLRDHQFESKTFAGGIYPLFSLLNHSCAPNAFYFNHITNGTMSVIANRSLKKGEQVLISYYRTFFTEDKKPRLGKLSLYNFNCSCIACRNNWPTLINMIATLTNFRYSCTACSRTFSHDQKDSAEFFKCELKEPLWKCGRCGQRYNFAEMHKRFGVNLKLSVEAQDMLLRGNPLEALKLFP